MERRSIVTGAIGAIASMVIIGAFVLGFGAISISGPKTIDAVAPVAQDTAPATAEMDAVAVVERVAPAVVTVNNLQQGGGVFGENEDPLRAGTGTGFIVDAEGYIVTNEHVVRNGDQFQVIFSDGTERDANLVGADRLSDLAVVKVDGDVPATVSLGDSDALNVGQPVLAIGSPLGEFTNTVTQGIVSALNRTSPFFQSSETFYTNLIQHDAAINPGNSGGPLFNAAGEVIGVNTLGIPETQGGPVQGLFFAVPASTVTDIYTQIREDGEVIYPFFGITSQPLTDELAAQLDIEPVDGQLVTDIEPGGPADEAGIEPGDVLRSIDGQPIDAQNPFIEILFAHEPDDTIEVVILRNGEEQTLQVTLSERQE